jgi:hypothetical protein
VSWCIDRLVSGGLITNHVCSSTWPKEFISAEVARANLEAVRRRHRTTTHY